MKIRDLALVLLLAWGSVSANGAAAAQSEEERARSYFTDTELVDQMGVKRRLYSDIMKGKIVLISLFYTTCDGMCPAINGALAEVQEELGDSLDERFRILSISIDPENDTESVMRDYAANFEPRKGWYFLTGKIDEIKTVVRKLGHAADSPVRHNGVLLLGDVDAAVWSKMAPTTPPQMLAAKMKLLADGEHGRK